MEFRIWWDYDRYDPQHPWCYEVKYLDSSDEGRCTSLADCLRATDKFVNFDVPVMQDNQPKRNTN